jgi:hypothetical protein
MVISFLELEPLACLLGTGLMAQELMRVTSPRNSLNGLAAPGQGSGEWGHRPGRDWVDAQGRHIRSPLEDAD